MTKGVNEVVAGKEGAPVVDVVSGELEGDVVFGSGAENDVVFGGGAEGDVVFGGGAEGNEDEAEPLGALAAFAVEEAASSATFLAKAVSAIRRLSSLAFLSNSLRPCIRENSLL